MYLHPLELLSKREVRQYRVSAAGVNEIFPSGFSQRACLERIPVDVNAASELLSLELVCGENPSLPDASASRSARCGELIVPLCRTLLVFLPSIVDVFS